MTANNGSNGIGFIGLLTIVFITLKLLGRLHWSWWWIASPVWISVVFFILVLGVVFLIAVVTSGDTK
jgi:hypothetical protein